MENSSSLARVVPEQSADWWQQMVRIRPNYERFARATTRRIPIIRLTPTPIAADSAGSEIASQLAAVQTDAAFAGRGT